MVGEWVVVGEGKKGVEGVVGKRGWRGRGRVDGWIDSKG